MKCFTPLDDKDANFHLDRKRSNIFPRMSRVVTFLACRYNSHETAWFQTTELKNPWKVPAKSIYSVWRLAQNSWDMSPWNEHHYFQFYKLGVGKVINRFHLPCTPLKTAVQNFEAFCSNHEACFEEILSLSIKYFVIYRKIGLEGVGNNERWAEEIQKPQSPHRGTSKLCANAPPYGQFQIFVFLKKLKIASLCMDNSRESQF